LEQGKWSLLPEEIILIFEDTKSIFDDKNFPYASQMFSKKYSCYNHCHKEIEIIYVSEGVVTFTNDGKTFLLKENEVFVVRPYTNHSIVNNQQSKWLAVLFDLDMIGPICLGGGNMPPNITLLDKLNLHSGFWPDETKKQIISFLVQMHQEYKTKTLCWPVALKALATQFLITALRNFPPEGEASKARIRVNNLKAAIEYIMENYKGDLSLTECADKIGYNPSYFSRLFQNIMGIPFIKYVNSLKVEQAKWLLLTTNLSILDVCYESGFSDVGTFNRIFKQYCLESPSSFRKQNVN
jgi:AraC-like DNA-binding protein